MDKVTLAYKSEQVMPNTRSGTVRRATTPTSD